MSAPEILQELESLGTAQNRKIYSRHGVRSDMYGVSYADLNRIAKHIKRDHGLASELWASGNHDARVLATKIEDPAEVRATQLETWAQDLDNYVIAGALADLAVKTPLARETMEDWVQNAGEWIGRAGWLMLAQLAMQDASLPETYFEAYLQQIEKQIHTRPNFTRNAMNSALIAIGLRSPTLQEKALASAGRIGKVVVDHGQTSCKTPDAAAYILKAANRKAAKA